MQNYILGVTVIYIIFFIRKSIKNELSNNLWYTKRTIKFKKVGLIKHIRLIKTMNK